ncbi:MAG TPA: START domain-containing protein [Polyangia bacterium]|nr:START domain-containing protein [Polyangia bacterium]
MPSRWNLLLPLSLLAAIPVHADEWKRRSDAEDVEIYTREVPGARVHESKAVGVIDAPPQACFKMVTDFENYTRVMPYTQEAKVLAREGDKVSYFYTVVDAPLVSSRDYTIRVVDDSAADAKGGGYHARWVIANDKGPPPRDKVVRVAVNTGYWEFTPVDGGRQTRVTYQVLLDPGGSIPTWIADRANLSAMKTLFKALRKAVQDPKYLQ